LRLLPQIPDSFVRVAESGLKNLGDLRKVADAGADAALVGTALMHDPRQLATWTTALEEHAS
jgi:indole-3-glycerol phosphate synthase